MGDSVIVDAKQGVGFLEPNIGEARCCLFAVQKVLN